MRVVFVGAMWLSLTASAVPVFAQQQRLFAITAGEAVELDPRPATLGTSIRRFRLPAGSSVKAVPFLGGEYLALTTGDGAVALLNTQSGAVRRFVFPDFSATYVVGTDGNTRLLVLGTSASGNAVLVADARSASLRFVDVGSRIRPAAFGLQIAYAPASDLLFVAKPRALSAESFHDIDIIQASTGSLIRTLDIWPVNADSLLTNTAGTRLVVTDAGNGTVVFDVASGTRMGHNSSPPLLGTLFTPTADELRNRLIVNIVLPDSGNPEFLAWRGLSAFSADSLQFLGRVRAPTLPLPPATPTTSPGWTETFDVSGLSASIFVLQGVSVATKNGSSTCHESQLIRLDAATGAVSGTVDTTSTLGAGACGAALVRLTEPAPPLLRNPDVSERRVTFTWPHTPGATEYLLEAGSAPGLANLAAFSVSDSTLTVDGVPPGVYFVRLRARNTVGISRASADIQVAVQ